MSQSLQEKIKTICEECGNDKGRMMDIVTALQKEEGGMDGGEGCYWGERQALNKISGS